MERKTPLLESIRERGVALRSQQGLRQDHPERLPFQGPALLLGGRYPILAALRLPLRARYALSRIQGEVACRV